MERARAMRTVMMSLIAAATVAGGAAGARAQETPRVGVAAGVYVNVPAEQAVEIASALGGALEGERRVEVVVSEEAGLAEGCATDETCLKELAGRLEVDEVLVLVIVRVGDRIRIEPTWADAETGTPQSRPPLNLNQGVERAEAIFSDAAPRLLPDAEPRVEPAGGEGAGREGEDTGAGAAGAGGAAGGAGAAGAGIGAGGGGSAGPIDRPRGRHLTTGTLVFGISGAALLTGAGLTGLLYSRAEDDQCNQNFDECDDGTLKAVNLAADLTAVVGAVSLGVAGYLYWTSGGRAEERQPAAVRIGAGPGDVGVSLGGSF